MTSEIKEKIGLRIRELRLAKNIKQCTLADMLNMERSHLTRIESGKHRPSDENLEKIAKILNVEIAELFDVVHIKTKDELIKNITEMLPNFEEKELQFCYKMLVNITQLKK